MVKYDEKLLNDFAERMKSNLPETPIQEVKPIEKLVKVKTDPEIQMNVWISKKTLKKVKQKALDENLSIKQLVTKAIESFLNFK